MSKLNVVMIIADTLRKDHCGCYGNTWIRTPNIDRLARMSTRFTRAYPESLPTIPVRRAMFSGRRAYPFKHYEGVPWDIVYLPGWQPMEPDRPVIAETLHEAGYQTGLVTDTLPMFAPGMNFERGFDQAIRIRGQQQDRWKSAQAVSEEELDALTFNDEHREALRWMLAQYVANTRERRDEADWLAPQVYQAAIEFLRENAAGPKPFFLVVDHFDPHEPWDPPQHYTDLYDSGYEGRGKRGSHDRYGSADWLSKRELKHLRALYAGEVTMCDTWLGKMLEAMDELDLMKETIIIFISDHGHSLGEHGLTGKLAWAMYPELIDIPALYYDPQVPGPKTADGLIYNLDLVTTAMNRIGVTAADPLDGIDLRPMIEGGHGGRPYVTSAFKDFVFVRRGKHVLIAHFKGGRCQLFDLERDPAEDQNIAGRHQELCKELFALALKDAGGELPLYEGHTTFADGSEDFGDTDY